MSAIGENTPPERPDGRQGGVFSASTVVASSISAGASAARQGAVASLVGAVRQISSERDRDEVLRWLMSAREILSSGKSTTQIATSLYKTVDTRRVATLIGNTFATTACNYHAARIPLAIKVALPVAIAGAAILGPKAVGIAGFGSAIGMPVVVLLFLGSAGVTSVIEAFTRDRGIRDPLTKLLLTFVDFESARRARKELLEAIRADAMVPRRADISPDDADLLQTLLKMDPVDFERHVMSFFEAEGYPTGLTPRSNDFGVDGYVMHPDGVVIVQCKRYAIDNPVGRPAIQQFKGVIEEQGALRGFVVTTSRFTNEALESASKSPRLILIDGEKLLDWHKSPTAFCVGLLPKI